MSRLKNTVPFIIMVAFAAAPRAGGQIPEGWEIVTITNDPSILDARVDMNDRGQIVFDRRTGAGDATFEIFLYDRGRLVQVTDDDTFDWDPAINNNGDIVWSRDFHDDGANGIVKVT